MKGQFAAIVKVPEVRSNFFLQTALQSLGLETEVEINNGLRNIILLEKGMTGEKLKKFTSGVESLAESGVIEILSVIGSNQIHRACRDWVEMFWETSDVVSGVKSPNDAKWIASSSELNLN